MTAPTPVVQWQLAASQPQLPLAEIAFHRWQLPNQQDWCLFYKVAAGYLLRFPNLADFTISADGREVQALPCPATDAITLEHLYLNQVLPLALSRQQQLVLHASAVEINQHAVAFLGRSGQGKSTLAASFASTGIPLVTDDGLQVLTRGAQLWVQPGHPSLRLWDDSSAQVLPALRQGTTVSYSNKLRIHAEQGIRYCSEALPLAALYVLANQEPTEVISIEPLAGHEAIMTLVSNSFLLDVEEKTMLRQHFTALAAVAQRQAIYRLHYPRHYDWLPMVRAAIAQHVQQLDAA